MQPNTCMEEGHLELIDDEQTYLPEIIVDDEMSGNGILPNVTGLYVYICPAFIVSGVPLSITS